MADESKYPYQKISFEVDPNKLFCFTFAGWIGEVVINTCGPQPMVSLTQPGMPKQTTGFTVKNDELDESED